MRRMLPLFLLLALAGAAAGQVIDHNDLAGVPNYSQSTMDAVGDLTFFFLHASVGDNIRGGLDILGDEDSSHYQIVPQYVCDTPPVSVWNVPNPTVAGKFYNAYFLPGSTKLLQFQDVVNNKGYYSPAIDVVLMKYCYLDGSDCNDIPALANGYLNMMESVESAHSQDATQFVYATMPLVVWRPADDVYFTNPPPNGIAMTDYYNNLEDINTYNDMIREYCIENGKLLYDIADIEAHDVNGNAITFSWHSKTLQAGCRDYYWNAAPTNNNGHLGNDIGKRQAGLGWYAVAAVAAGNQGPIAVDDTYYTPQNQTLIQSAPGVMSNDAGSGITAVKDNDGNPTHGTVTLNSNGSFTYTPTNGYVGSDIFTYHVTDGQQSSSAATVTITIGNHAPVAGDDSATTSQDNAVQVSVLANDTDADSDTLTVTGVTQGANGDVTYTSTNVTYTPDTGWSGNDSFTYTISDGRGGTDTATVSVTVTPSGGGSWTGADIGTVSPAGSYTLDGGEFTVNGSGAGIAGTTDELHYVYRQMTGDGEIIARVFSVENTGSANAKAGVMMRNALSGEAKMASLTITYGSPNGSVRWQRRTEDSGTATNNSANNRPYPQWLKLTRTGDSFAAAYSNDGVTYTTISGSPTTIDMGDTIYVGLAVTNGTDGTLNTSVIDNVTAPGGSTNNPPVAYDDYFTNDEDQMLSADVLGNDQDADDDDLSIDTVPGTAPAHGSVTLYTDGSFDYVPAANYVGDDSFTYRAYDGQAYSSTYATVTVSMYPINDQPTAAADSGYSVNQDSYVTISAPGVLANDTDVDSGTITAVNASDPAHGSVTLNTNGSFTYTPDAGYYGADSFTYQAYDGTAYSAAATVSLTVSSVNPTVTVTASIASASEPSTDGQFTVTRTGSTSGQLVVNVAITGTATNGTDYTSIGSTVTIQSGQASVTVPVDVTDDGSSEGSETCILTVNSGSGYSVGTPSNDTVTIADNDSGTPQTLYTTADTFTLLSSPDNNYGSSTSVQLRYTAGAVQRQSYLYFDLSGVNSTINGATLRLYQSGLTSTSLTFDVYVAAASWVENTVTWNNKPATSGSSIGNQVSRTTAQGAGWVEVTLTASAIDTLRTGNNYGLVIIPRSGGSTNTATFDSREASPGNDAELVVTP